MTVYDMFDRISELKIFWPALSLLISSFSSSPKINIAIDGQQIEQVTSYNYVSWQLDN